jgi:hypothetical protein
VQGLGLYRFGAANGEQTVMQLKRRRTHVRCLSAVLCLLVMFNSSQAMVLCIGEDGHVALEASDSRCCGHLPGACCPQSTHALTVTGCLAQDDDCGPCLDIPISSGLAEALQAPNDVQPDVSVLSFFDFSLFDRTGVCQSHRDLKFLIVQSYFTPLRSVILLI